MDGAVKTNIMELAARVIEDWENFVVAEVNDHVVRLSVLQRSFHWHAHTNSDEVFYVIEGLLYVDFEDRTEEVGPGQMLLVPKSVRHRTRAKERTVSLCFESRDSDVSGG